MVIVIKAHLLKLTDAYNNSRPKVSILCACVSDYYYRMVAHSNTISSKSVILHVTFNFLKAITNYGTLIFIITFLYSEIREILKNYNSSNEIFYVNINDKSL